MESKLKIGQVLYSYDFKEYTINKIGNKYFYVKEKRNYKFSIEDLTYRDPGYSQHNFTLYIDKQEILDKKEQINLNDKIKRHFSSSYTPINTLEQLRTIALILEL